MSPVGKNIDKALDRTRARTPAARAVIAQLARHANRKLLAWPTQELLAQRIGISTRQVRTYLRKFEAWGEIDVVEKGANRPTKYRVVLISDGVLERKPTSTPTDHMDRNSTTAPENRWGGSAASVGRKPASGEVIEENCAQPPSVSLDGKDGNFAEKRKEANPASSPASRPTSQTATSLVCLETARVRGRGR